MDHNAWQRSVEEHRQAVLELVRRPATTEVPLDDALGLVLAHDATSPAHLPGAAVSAMDGFAVRHADLSPGAVLPVLGDLPAGAPADRPLAPGGAVRIMTGAVVPPGADTVVAVERTDIPRGPVPLPRHVTIHRPPQPGDAIRAAGSDVAAGSVVVAAGTRLGAAALAALAATGHAAASVHPAPRVRVVSTGAELRSPGEPLAPGQLHDSNSFLMASLARALGHPTERRSVHHDDPAELAAALPGLLAGTDALVLSGGASAGAYEVVRQVLGPRGIDFGQVAMQPGKPQGLGVLDGVPVFCLPGNPVACAVGFLAFVRPWLDASSARPAGAGTSRVVLASPAAGTPGRTRFLAARLVGGRAQVCTAQQSHQVARMVGVDGFVVLGQDQGTVQGGAAVEWLALP